MKQLRYIFIFILSFLAFLLLAWQVDPIGVLAQASHSTDQPAQGETRPAPKPTVRGLIDLDKAEERLGRQIPTGKGIVMGHVEGNDGMYMPNIRSSRYQDMFFLPHSGPSQTFAHADITARLIYGRTGLAPAVNTVHFYSAPDWLATGYLNTGSHLPPAHNDPIRIFNHSWISMASPFIIQSIRRIDYLIDQHDVIMCVGVNNGVNSTVPALLASAYNTIAVGVMSGNNSGGFTTTEVLGRCKPDIVGPGSLTSYATPVVSACAARLLELADEMDAQFYAPIHPTIDELLHTDEFTPPRLAAKPQTIKAVLLASATKSDSWKPLPNKPLDEHLGAGLVNIDNSLMILSYGPQQPGQIDSRYGWDFNALKPLEKNTYHFKTSQALGEASIILTWHRKIEGRTGAIHIPGKPDQIVWLDRAMFTNFDLALIHIDDEGHQNVMATSNSEIDNVEHIYLPELAHGRYRIEVIMNYGEHIPHEIREQMLWQYALAWRFEQPTPQATESE